MSADNGIYIKKFKDGWRVVEGACIENAFQSKKAMREYFSESPLFKTEHQAWEYAITLYKENLNGFGIIEYGIQIV